MAKDILYNEKARNSLFRGIDKVANAVKVTLGPKGRYVAIDKGFETEIVNDGVTVAKAIELKDKKEEMGAQLIKEVASKTQDLAGDGTTTATVLTQAIIKEGLKYINSGANPLEIKKGIEEASKEVVKNLKEKSIIIKDKEQIESVATISANNDSEIGKLIASAIEKVGENGVITVEEASGTETNIEVTQGMEFDRGYLSPYMITDLEKKLVEFENPLILVTDYTISNLKDILKLLQYSSEHSKPLLIISEDLDGEALGGLVINLMRGTIKVAAVKAPGFGEEKKELLKDIAALTGAKVILKDEKIELKDVDETYLGTAKKVKISEDKTTIIEANGSELKERIELIKKQMENTTSKSAKEALKKRIASLTGGVAILKIGAATETEMKDKKHRVDDALNATKAAIEEGIIAGGGIALLRSAEKINLDNYKDDKKLGAKILKKALSYPLNLILENGGLDASVIKNKILEEKNNFNFGFNAKTEKYVDLVKDGVIDPVKVTRLALINAVSVASLILTTEAIIVEEKEEKPAPPLGNQIDLV